MIVEAILDIIWRMGAVMNGVVSRGQVMDAKRVLTFLVGRQQIIVSVNGIGWIEKQIKNRKETGSDLSLGERLTSVKTSKPQALL